MTRPSKETDLKVNENINTINPNKLAFWEKRITSPFPYPRPSPKKTLTKEIYGQRTASLAIYFFALTLKVRKICVTAGEIIPRLQPTN